MIFFAGWIATIAPKSRSKPSRLIDEFVKGRANHLVPQRQLLVTTTAHEQRELMISDLHAIQPISINIHRDFGLNRIVIARVSMPIAANHNDGAAIDV